MTGIRTDIVVGVESQYSDEELQTLLDEHNVQTERDLERSIQDDLQQHITDEMFGDVDEIAVLQVHTNVREEK